MKCDNCCDIIIPNLKAKMQKQIEARDEYIQYLEDHDRCFITQEEKVSMGKLVKAIEEADKEAQK